MISRTLIVKLIISFLFLFVLSTFAAEARNEYLNSYPNECRTGEVDLSVSGRQYDYDNYDSSWNESNSQELRLTFRKYLGNLRCTERNDLRYENEQLKQQLELMKMCNKVNRNPSLKHNENFTLLVSKCSGIVPLKDEIEDMPTGSLWDDLKEDYIEANPDSKTMDNNKTLKIPKDFTGPLPEPTND